MLPKPTNDSCLRSFVGRTTTTRRSSKPKLKRPTRLERREKRPKGWNRSGGLRKLSRQRKKGGRGVSLPALGTGTGTTGEIGVVGRDIGRVMGRKTRREVARRDVADVALNLPKGTGPVVPPGADLMMRTSPTALPDAAPIPTRRRTDHTVLLDAPNTLTDPVHRAAVHIPLVHPTPTPHPPLSHPRWTSISRNRTTPT